MFVSQEGLHVRKYATWKVDGTASNSTWFMMIPPFFPQKTTKIGSGNQHLVYHRILYSVPPLHSGKLTQQWKMDTLKVYFLLKMGIFRYIAMLV